nr:hypothetical protein [Tanacetum cinerariifolium]
MFEDKSYEAHEDHKKLYDALVKSLERDYSDQLLSDMEEARLKKRKRRDLPRTPSGSPPPQPPPLPPPTGVSGSPGTSGASGSSKLPLPPPLPSTVPQSMAWTTSDTRYKSAGVSRTQELSPTHSLIQYDSIPDEPVHLFDDEDSENDHLPKADSRKVWWKPLPKEERTATLEPAWTIPSSNVSDVKNNWATALVSAYETHAENSLLAKTGDMINFLNWYYRQLNKTALTPADLEMHAYEVVKAFHPDSRTIDFQKAASYPDFGLELLVPEQMWIDDVCTYDMSAKYGISHWWFNRQKFYIDIHASPSRQKKSNQPFGFSVSSDLKPTPDMAMDSKLSDSIAGDFQLGIKSYQSQLNLTKPGWDATGYEFKHDFTIIESPRVVVFLVNNNERKIMRFNEIYKFSDGTLTRILEALACRVKEFKIKRLNLSMNTRF